MTALLRPPLHADDSHTLVRVRRFMRDRRDLCNFLVDIVNMLEQERVTGTLYLDFGGGHFGSARLEERARIDTDVHP